MADNVPLDRLPDRQLSDEKVEEYLDFYVGLLGFVPPRIQARTDLLARIDPELLAMQEEIRRHCMYPKCFDVKTAQLMLFGMLLVNLQDATRLHAIAAYRAGATFEELSAVVEQEAKQRPEVLRLITHPGVGPITALAFVLIIDSAERFACGKQIASYVGLIPCEDSSSDRGG